MSETREHFVESYAAAFDEYLRNPGEAALAAAYELGRDAVRRELSVLDLATVHHDVVDAAATGGRSTGTGDVARAGRAFFLESLSSFEMVQRGYHEAHEAALVERRHAAILRQLSNFLADASLALDAAASLEEMLQLVVEQARELIGARGGVAQLVVDGAGDTRITARAEAHEGDGAATGKIAAPLVGWDGRALGVIELFDKAVGEFSEVDVAVLVHLAQMASAAVERVQLFRRDRATAQVLERGRGPASLPELTGVALAARYRAAVPSSAGGGWYDVVPLPDGSIAIAIGDVVDGPAAAAAAGPVRTGFRAVAATGEPPETAVSRIGALVREIAVRGSSMLYAVVDRTHGTVRIVRAGHEPPVLLAPDGRASILDAPAGPPLPGTPDEPYVPGEGAVRPGAALVFAGGGARRLDLAAAGAATLDPDALWKQVLHALPERFEGDATLLVVRFD